MRAVVLLAVLGAAAAFKTDAEANPIRRVVKLLQKMQSEIKEEGKREEKLFQKYQCYCQQGTAKLTQEITDAQEKIKQLNADIEAKSARQQYLDQEVAEHKKDRAEAKAAVEKATKIREKEHAEYVKASGDSKANIDALNKAVAVLGRGMGKAFLQQKTNVKRLQRAISAVPNIADAEKEEVLTFLTQSPYGDYQASSGEIVGILKEMKDEMDRDLGGIIKDEEDAVKSYEALMAAKNEQIASATAAIEKKTVRSGELKVEVVEHKNEVENTKNELGEDQKFVLNMAEACKTKEEEYNKRVEDRNQEQVAISEAIKILNDDDALDIFKKTLPSPGQPSFLQKGSNARESRRVKALGMIQAARVVADRRAPQLGLIAYMLRVSKVDFTKVLKMIDDMVKHLDQEQKDDDTQLNWCNAEIDANNDKEKALKGNIADLSAELDELAERIKQAEADIAQLKSNIEATEKASADATEQRKKENAAYVQSTTELTAALQLINKAKNRLQKYYNPALYKPPPQRELTEEERIAQNMGEVLPTEAPKMIAGTNIAVNLIAKKPAAAPDTWEGDRKNKGAQSGGVVALMDMLTRDLEMQMQDVEADEKVAQRDYEKLIADGKESVAKDSATLTGEEGAKADAETRANDAKNERRLKHEELMAVQKYIGELHGNCDFLIQNYDFRKTARSQERDSLMNAKAVLSGANFS
jgi:predicted  nucleic acid-binding Zn-ribbon protein